MDRGEGIIPSTGDNTNKDKETCKKLLDLGKD